MTALLSVRGDKADKTLDNLKEAKRMGIKILPPSVNASDMIFKPEGKGIRFGLQSIAGIGEKVVQAIISERDKNGEYKDFNDFYKRTTYKGSPVNRGAYRTLIEAGCFDEFEPNRYKLLNHYNLGIRKDKVYNGRADDLEKETTNVKGNHSVRYDETAFNEKLALEMEFKLIGIYVSGSPFEDLPFTSLQDMELSRGRRDKKEYEIGGRITNVKVIKTKKGQPMAFVTLETQLEPFEITFFPDAYEDVQQHLYKENIVVIRGYKEESYYKGEKKEQFIGTKVLVKQAKKLKKQMGVKDSAPLPPLEDESPIMAQLAPSKKKSDPVAEMMSDKPKGKKKKRRDDDDVAEFFDDEEDIA